MISVIVPIYNVEKYLRECLSSIENQTYEDIEILMVNDGSTDGCEKICREFAERDRRFILINQIHSDVCEARNKGVQESRGEFISFVDSDDTVDQDFLEKLLTALLRDEADVSQCGIREGAKRVGRPARVYSKDEIFPALLQGGNFLYCTGVKLYKRKIIEGLRFPEGRPIFEDGYWTAMVLERCNVVSIIGEAKYNYRTVAGSLSRRKFSEEMECGMFKNRIGRVLVIERNILDTDTESMYKLFDQVRCMLPWILGSHSDLSKFDTYKSLKTLVRKLSIRGFEDKVFHIVLKNSDFRKAQNEYLWYELKSGNKDMKYKLQIIYRKFKRRLFNGYRYEN